MRVQGLKWCRACRCWLPVGKVTKNGLCRVHENADYRRRYADGMRITVAAKNHARRRRVKPISQEAADLLLDLYENRCAYCGGPVETWDHLVPITLGGETVPGNMVPACRSCNSRKRAKDPLKMLPFLPPFVIEMAALHGVL